MAKLKGRVYIPKTRLHEDEHYPSFKDMIEARPDCKSDVTGEPAVHYTTVPEDEYETGKVDKVVV